MSSVSLAGRAEKLPSLSFSTCHCDFGAGRRICTCSCWPFAPADLLRMIRNGSWCTYRLETDRTNTGSLRPSWVDASCGRSGLLSEAFFSAVSSVAFAGEAPVDGCARNEVCFGSGCVGCLPRAPPRKDRCITRTDSLRVFDNAVRDNGGIGRCWRCCGCCCGGGCCETGPPLCAMKLL